MPDLRAVQARFVADLADAEGGALAIYRNTIARGAIDALAANFPVTRALVGETMFDTIAGEFAAVEPPRRPVLAGYGCRFPAWIEEQPWASEIAYLAEVAALERLYLEAMFAPDARALAPAAIAHIGPEAWEHTRLRLHPATRFGWTKHPAMAIWLAHAGAHELPGAEDWPSQGGLFLRPSGEVTGLVLDRAGHRFLFGLRLGETVGKAALAASTLYPPADIAGLFASLVAAGAFTTAT
jgi:hypothetical protein